MTKARTKALAKRDDYRLKRAKPVNWDAFEALLKTGMGHREASMVFEIKPEALAMRCKKEFGVPLSVKFSEYFLDGQARKPISWERAGELFQVGAEISEACNILGVTPATLARRCSAEHGMELTEWREMHFSKLKVKLRQTQAKLALGTNDVIDPATNTVIREGKMPNVTMALHLGKHMLGQVDKTETKMEISGVPDEQKKKLASLLDIGST